MDSKRDWGHSKDYVNAMWLMLQQDTPDDYVVATGETRTVREFVDAAFHALDMQLEWHGSGKDEYAVNKATGKTVVKINPQFFRPAEVELLLGDPTKAETKLGWKREIDFNELVSRMAKADAERISHE
ncbi:MAG: GDP-mannose 4,6-dehydratase, partial [Ruthenibacterium sp.]